MELRVASAPLHVYMADIRLTLYGSKVASFAREFGPFLHPTAYHSTYRLDFESEVTPEGSDWA